ncbi:hypothetical protein E2P74_00020 [Limosilactobacillus fermentum]|uniref:hypothetical protein n=1 Tax=Limosilactobacillus fermentum TaxID=1613 RepID=UPI001075C056|nr:hypothetical protein [Limosilactobacillus fermentum]TFZ20184.1 hypothetical protein E2P74_00020 [Limosilactobacillus fermentum]
MNIENTLYHGSKNNFNEFEIPKYHTNGGTLGFGTYLTDSIERANSYADTSGYLYTVELTDELSQSQPLNATKVTLTLNQVAEKQIEDEEYPYILSDWEEPTSETTIDAGNNSGADTLVPILNDVGIHYAVLDAYNSLKSYHFNLYFSSTATLIAWGFPLLLAPRFSLGSYLELPHLKPRRTLRSTL